MNKQFLTVMDAAEFFNISRATMYQELKKNNLPVHRIGRCMRIRIEDLEAWADTTRQGFREEPEID